MKMQNSILPNFEISIFEKLGFGKMRNWHLTLLKKLQNRHLKTWNWIAILNFGAGNLIFKIQNRFLQFLSNLVSGPKNLKSAMSKTPKSTFSLQNSHFRFKFFFDQNLDFVLGRASTIHHSSRCYFNSRGSTGESKFYVVTNVQSNNNYTFIFFPSLFNLRTTQPFTKIVRESN